MVFYFFSLFNVILVCIIMGNASSISFSLTLGIIVSSSLYVFGSWLIMAINLREVWWGEVVCLH